MTSRAGQREQRIRRSGRRSVIIEGDNLGVIHTGDVLAIAPDPLVLAAEDLAVKSSAAWKAEALQRGIETASVAPVSWSWASFAPSAQHVFDKPVSPGGPPPLPGHVRSLPDRYPVAGGLDDVFPLYAHLPHGRLSIIGGWGAGKSSAMVLLMLAAFDHRQSLPAAERDRCPVPLWVSAREWDAAQTSLPDCVANLLARDYPYLLAHGADVPARLVESGRLALFLDGLDEMSAAHRQAAMRRLDTDCPHLRITVTSREREFRETNGARRRPLPMATLVLEPVAVADGCRYLLAGHTQDSTRLPSWQQLVDHLQAHPRGPLARALSRPLDLSLVKGTYDREDDPAPLCHTETFDTEERIRDHLLDRLLDRAYPDPGDPARWCLRWCALNMGQDRDLRWWEVPGWVPLWRWRLALSVVVAALTTVLLGALVNPGAAAVGAAAGVVRCLFLDRSLALQVRLRWPNSREWATLLKLALLQFACCPALFTVMPARFVFLAAAAMAGLNMTVALVSRIWGQAPSDEDGPTPELSNRQARRAQLVRAAVYGIALAVSNALFLAAILYYPIACFGHPDVGFALTFGIAGGTTIGLAAGLSLLLTPSPAICELVFLLTGRGRVRILKILRGAHERRVLRQAGGVYQFRHAALQDRLRSI